MKKDISVSIRPYVPADYEAVSELYKIPGFFGGQFDADRDSKERLEGTGVLVAEENGKIVGTVSILADKRFAWLVRFAVTDPQAVELLYNEACNILKAQGHKQVLVYAPVGDYSFEVRYTSLGFKKGSDYTCFWKEI